MSKPAAFTFCTALFLLSNSALVSAADKPPLSPDSPTPMTGESRISAIVEFGIPALDRTLERKVPKRLATFRDRTTRCWHRRIFGREVDVDCEYSGFVERVGGVSLRAERGRLVAATPLFGTISAQGMGRFTSRLHGTAEGAMTVYATARPRLRSDWSVALDMSEGFRWSEPPTLTILGFRVGLERYVEPQIRKQLERVKADVEASTRDLDIRGKASQAWQQSFRTVQLVDNPPVWLSSTPQSVAFAGLHARGEVLEGAVEITGTTETSVGSEPAAPVPAPLPQLGRDVDEPGTMDIVLPVNIAYGAVRQKIQDAMTLQTANGAVSVREIEVYPSGGRVVIGLRLAASGDQADAGEWIYLSGMPKVNLDSKSVQFPGFAISNAPEALQPALQQLLNGGTLTQALQQIQLNYQPEIDRMLASANERLSRPLGNGFRSEATLTSAGVSSISLLPDGLRVSLRVGGRLKLLYGL